MIDESYVIPVLTELREMRAKTFKLTDYHAFTKLKEDDCKFILSRAIELIEYLDGKLEDLDRFQDLAISHNNELQQERENSTQLEQRIKVLTVERDLAKKLVTRKSEELKRQLKEKYGKVIYCAVLKDNLDKKCREVGELTKELEQEHECSNELGKELHTVRMLATQILKEKVYLRKELEHEQKKSTQLEQRCSELVIDRDKLSDSVTYWRNLAKTLALYGIHATKETYDYYLEVCKTMLNDPCNFCGNCRYYAQMGKDDGDFEGICTQHYIKRVDPDDASCKHFQSNQVDRVTVAKPEFPCCDHCNREDCDNCTLCPF